MQSSLGDDEGVLREYIFKNFKVERVSGVCVGDEMVREVRSLTEFHPPGQSPALPAGAAGSVVAADCCGVVDGELVGADCEMAVEKQRHTINDAVPILFSMLNFPLGRDSLGKRVPRGRSPEKP